MNPFHPCLMPLPHPLDFPRPRWGKPFGRPAGWTRVGQR
jgi:hypothetical protein